MRFSVLVPLIAGFAAPGFAAAQDQTAGGWQAMTFHDFQIPSSTDPLQTLVWPDVIREANAYVTTQLKRPLNGKNALVTALSSTYRDGARTIIVSTALSRQCESGANEKGAEIEPSNCPVRIATIQDGKLVGMKTVSGCYADHNDPDLPAGNRDDVTYTRFDATAGTVALRTRVGGRDIPSCAHVYPIR